MPRSKDIAVADRSRQRIVKIATDLIKKNGTCNTSLSDIARESGISKGTLYYYYPTKGELLFDIIYRHIKQVTKDLFSWISSVGGNTPPQGVLQVAYRYLAKARNRGGIHIFLIYEAVFNNPKLRERVAEMYQEWKHMLKDRLDSSLGNHRDNEILSELLLACLDGIIVQRALGVENIPIAGMTNYLFGAGVSE